MSAAKKKTMTRRQPHPSTAPSQPSASPPEPLLPVRRGADGLELPELRMALRTASPATSQPTRFRLGTSQFHT